MYRIFTIIFSMCSCAMMAQDVNLVSDYLPGTEGLCDYGVSYYQNSLIFYKEIDSESRIYQYDKDTDVISPILTNSDVENDIVSFSTNGTQCSIYSGINDLNQTVYISHEKDFSDLKKLFSVEGAQAYISRARFYGDYYVFFVHRIVESTQLLDLYLIDKQGEQSLILSDLPDNAFDYNIGKIGEYLILAPEKTAIDGKNIIAYDMDQKTETPITQIISGYQDCGLNFRLYIQNENILTHFCGEETYTYDITNQEYIELALDDYAILVYDTPEHLHYRQQNTMYKYDKNTGVSDIIFDNVYLHRRFNTKLLASTTVGEYVTMILYDVITGEIEFYESPFLSDQYSLAFSRIQKVESGYHFTLYNYIQEEAYLCRINEDTFKVIDEFNGLRFRSAPAAYDEDIYFTKNDPEYGPELFVVNYTPSSAIDIENSFDLSIAPNPAQSHISLLTTEHIERIEISNISGQSIKTEQYNNSSIDISDIAPGIYILKAINRDGLVATQKLIVTK